MLKQPKKSKFNKLQKIRIKSLNRSVLYLTKNNTENGKIVALQNSKLNQRQIHAFKETLLKNLKRKKNKVISSIFPDLTVTRKPLGSRMGKGKGSTDFLCTKIYKGAVIFSICGNFKLSSSAKGLCQKLPFLTKFVQKNAFS
uniref:Ribosomal protein L16 n=1 Tax=Aureoumbra lagunensis TaxID=44058 RepID=A0A7U0KSI6_9STRA|nr:ribosomal protein L16 [Aureoumbra lagunensis]QQW50419.1 ribosomal protein L16 [Aureoumbra lagunensis]